MLLVGLTGGIGSGKSTVAALLAGHGALVVDADRLAREVVEPGTPALGAILGRFGAAYALADGHLDRTKLAGLVFNDETARRDLETIVHPALRARVASRLDELRAGEQTVVLDHPLLAESGVDTYPFAGVLVVDAPEDIALERLVGQRGMDPEDARARIAAQASRAERRAIADFVILNIGTPAELEEMVRRAWVWIEGLRPALAT